MLGTKLPDSDWEGGPRYEVSLCECWFLSVVKVKVIPGTGKLPLT